jgi:hypothetical protein
MGDILARRTGGWSIVTDLMRRIEAGLVSALFSVAILSSVALSWTIHRPRPMLPGGIVSAADADGDGIVDEEEDALLSRYAPVVILSRDEPAWPANIDWLLGRVRLDGAWMSDAPAARDAFLGDVRRGSERASDWTAYGHAYRRNDGGIELQYWFYYPFNDGYLLFDHDSDWEHVSVTLDSTRRPVSFAAAAHDLNAPGLRHPWDDVEQEDGHPFFFVAEGTHAAYARRDDAPAWERLATPGRERRWRVGQDGSALVNLGERGRARAGADRNFLLSYGGLWGPAVPSFGSSSPHGPPFQGGFCVDARSDSCR